MPSFDASGRLLGRDQAQMHAFSGCSTGVDTFAVIGQGGRFGASTGRLPHVRARWSCACAVSHDANPRVCRLRCRLPSEPSRATARVGYGCQEPTGRHVQRNTYHLLAVRTASSRSSASASAHVASVLSRRVATRVSAESINASALRCCPDARKPHSSSSATFKSQPRIRLYMPCLRLRRFASPALPDMNLKKNTPSKPIGISVTAAARIGR